MRKAFLAALALSPTLLHAQANSPVPTAKPAAILESRLVAPAPAPAAPTLTKTVTRRVSSGVVAPQLLGDVSIPESSRWRWKPTETERTVTVSMLVATDGTPTHVQMAQSFGAEVDQDVVAAVRRFRFAPATLDKQPVPLVVNLKINIVKSAL